MTKDKNKKINSFGKKKYLNSFPQAWHEWLLLEIPLLAIRLSECNRALQEYDDVPSEGEIHESTRKMVDRLKKGFSQEYPNNSKYPKILYKLTDRLTNDFLRVFKRSPNDSDLLDSIQNNLDREADEIMKYLNIKNNEELWNVIIESIRDSNIHEQQSLFSLQRACVLLGISGDHYDKMKNYEKLKFMTTEHFLRSKSCEALGYWTAKLEEMKRGKRNVKTRTVTKETNKSKLKEMMKSMSKKDCRLQAQKDFQVTDRTILSWMKEIKDEETALLRKYPDIA